jgi:hypothetical protein
MTGCVRRRTLGRAAVFIALLVALWGGCERGEQSAQQAAPEQTPAAAAVPPAPPVKHEPLPRSVAGVTLGMDRDAVEATLGHLTCHPGKAGCEVCDPDRKEDGGAIRHLQVYLNHGQVISVSYDGPAPANALDALNQLIDRFGSPALSGVRERDQTGRLHEIYGWKDEQSLYSVRFMWHDGEAEGRELLGTATALWDRKGYQLWESETLPHGEPAPDKRDAAI